LVLHRHPETLMSLHVPKNAHFAYLSTEERAKLEDAFDEADIEYTPDVRARLLDGLDRDYVKNVLLSSFGSQPATLLFDDLKRMNIVQRLGDGTVPLEQWLRNAVSRPPLRAVPQRVVFEDALNKVVGKEASAGTLLDQKDTPSADFEELITDGVDDLQEVSFLETGASRLAGVAKVLVPRFESGAKRLLGDGKTPLLSAGTGWLIGADLLMTNYHVIRNRGANDEAPTAEDLQLQVLGSTASFFFDSNDATPQIIKVAEVVATGDAAKLDFAILRLGEKPGIAVLPVSEQEVTVPAPEVTPKGTIKRVLAVNIIQHPSGGPKRVALRNNLVYTAEYPKVHYFTDTLSGSSGSPVLDDSWRVVALHRAHVARRAQFHGQTLGYINEGIQLRAIMGALRTGAEQNAALKAVLAEIDQAQTAFPAL
jgi:hypothetical protein